jgi:hypothetical protein
MPMRLSRQVFFRPPLPGGEGWGEGRRVYRRRAIKNFEDVVGDRARIFIQDMVPEPQCSKTLRRQPVFAVGVMPFRLLFFVLWTVEFHDQFSSETNKVSHEGSNGRLASKPIPTKLIRAQ